MAIVIAGDSRHPQIADATAPFVYARIMGTTESDDLGYPPKTLDIWAERAKGWAKGEAAKDLEYVSKQTGGGGRDVYLYVISGHKEKNPAAATALIERLSDSAKKRPVKKP